MRSTYRVLAGLIALGVLVQAGAIAFGWFDVLSKVDEGTLVVDSSYEGNAGHMVHGMNGMMVMPLLGLLLLLVSFFAKVPGGVKWAAAVFGSIVLQVVLAFIAFGAPVVGALHGVNAVVVLALAVLAARRAGTPTPAVGDAAVRVPAQPAATDAPERRTV